MTDAVTICNLALDAIGARAEIASLNENSAAARKLNLHYNPAVESILQAAHWNFARKQIALSVLKAAAGTPENPSDASDAPPSPWVYEYALPSDCVQARYIMPMVSSVVGASAVDPTFSGPPVRFMLSSDVDGNGNDTTVLLTNQPSAMLVYTYRVANAQLFDGQFVTALANYLGAKVSPSLSGDKALTRMAEQLAMATIKDACASNGNEGLTVIDGSPDWMRVRGYASDWANPPGSMFWNAPQSLTFVT